MGVGQPMGLAAWLATDVRLYRRLEAAVEAFEAGRRGAQEVRAWQAEETAKLRGR